MDALFCKNCDNILVSKIQLNDETGKSMPFVIVVTVIIQLKNLKKQNQSIIQTLI